jgi:hypothetical protein
VEVFTEYFKELEEESIRDNFVVIYELLDEMMDFGHPQTTESKILQELVVVCIHHVIVAHGEIGTSHKSRINWKFRHVRPLRSQMQSAGEAKA